MRRDGARVLMLMLMLKAATATTIDAAGANAVQETVEDSRRALIWAFGNVGIASKVSRWLLSRRSCCNG
jgi:hypothetical protein